MGGGTALDTAIRCTKDTFDAFVDILRYTKEASDAFPPLKTTAAGILVIIDLIKDIRNNRKELEEFVSLVASRVAELANDPRMRDQPVLEPGAPLTLTLERLTGILERAKDEFEKMKSRKQLLRRTVLVGKDKRKIVSLHNEAREVLEGLNFSANIASLRYLPPREVPQSTCTRLDLNRVPPPPVTHFYGREEYVREIVTCIQTKVDSGFGAHLMVQGPGGMGKTSVALAVFHERIIEGLFGEKRYFVRCEAATTSLLLLSAIASALRLEDMKQDPLDSVLTALRTGPGPALLVLDNAETFWYTENQTEVRTVLQHISSIQMVTLILTMRGIELPPVVKWDPLGRLDSLALPDAREAFLAIAPKEEGHQELDSLLEEVDCVPLAVTLLARVSQTGGDVSSLRQRLKKGQSNVLQLGGDDREDSIAVSIKLSLESQPMKRCPSALRLLSIVAYLPDGTAVSDLQEMLAIPPDELDEAHHTLLRLSLAYQSTENRLTTLSPIRIYIGQCAPPIESDLGHLRNWYLFRLSTGWLCDLSLYTGFFPQEKGNIMSVLPPLITGTPLTHRVVHAVFHFSSYLEHFDVPDGKLLELIIERSAQVNSDDRGLDRRFSRGYRLLGMARKPLKLIAERTFAQANTNDHELEYDLSWCFYLLGIIRVNQAHFDEAERLLSNSQGMFLTLGETSDVIICLGDLAELKLRAGMHREAEQLTENAMELSREIDDQEIEAYNYHTLGRIREDQGRFSEAVTLFETAAGILQRINSRWLGDCLSWIASVRESQGRCAEAAEFACRALTEFRKPSGDRQRIADTLRLQVRVGTDLVNARANAKEAIELFEQLRRPSDVIGCLLALARVNLHQSTNPDDPTLQEAGELIEEARRRAHQHNLPSDLITCLNTLGEIRGRQYRCIEALNLLNEAREQSAKLGDRFEMARCLAELGRIKTMQAHSASSHELHHRREGKRLLWKAVSLYRQILQSPDALHNMVCDLETLSQVALDENELIRAWDLLKECRDVSHTIERTDLVEKYQRKLETLGCRILRSRTRTLRGWNEQRKERLKWRWRGNVRRVQIHCSK